VDRRTEIDSLQPLLAVDISVDYPAKSGVLRSVRFLLHSGEIMGLIGLSGSGKSTIALAVLRLLELRGGTMRGSILFAGRELTACREWEMRALRGSEIALVMQSPMSALNPALRIETQMREAWRAHRPEPWRSARAYARQLLTDMGLPDDESFLRCYPRQLSVGQAQRVVIAMAVMHRPKLLVADEPTSALDAISQVEILELFRRLNREIGMAILYVSHDLESVLSLCQTVGVLQQGRLVESGPVERVFTHPEEAFTRQLLAPVRCGSASTSRYPDVCPDRAPSPASPS
jgi:peptide/nickel transport system ATP-binding protein